MTLPDRFWAKVQKTETCWLWTGKLLPRGYARCRVNGGKMYVHVAAWTSLVGPVSAGLELDHLCRVNNCVNPAHLEPVTHAENMRRGIAGKVGGARQRAKTQCPHGHPYDAVNTDHRPDGSRRCRTCHRTAERRRKERSK